MVKGRLGLPVEYGIVKHGVQQVACPSNKLQSINNISMFNIRPYQEMYMYILLLRKFHLVQDVCFMSYQSWEDVLQLGDVSVEEVILGQC